MTTPPTDLSPLELFSGPDAPAESDLYKCVHCGFCLQACPTYVETGLETESPRGRIALMKAVNEGRISIGPTVTEHWDLCIQCRACEAVCPSGVPYGRLIEATMAQVERQRKPSAFARAASSMLLRGILPHQGRLALVMKAMRMYKGLGIQAAVRKTGALRLVSKSLAELENTTPDIPSGAFKAKGQVIPAVGERRARVALLSGCVMPLVHGPQMDAVTRVLARNGCEVVVAEGQACCGAIHSHVGDMEMARELARRNVDAFLSEPVDAVVVASAGCGARMKEYGHLLEDDGAYSAKAASVGGMVRDVHEFLADLPLVPPKGRASLPGHVPGLVPPVPRPAHHRSAPPAPPRDSRAGAGPDGRLHDVLRRRGDVCDHSARVLASRPEVEDGQRPRDGGGGPGHGEPRLRNPAPAGRGPVRPRRGGALRDRPPGRGLRGRELGSDSPECARTPTHEQG